MHWNRQTFSTSPLTPIRGQDRPSPYNCSPKSMRQAIKYFQYRFSVPCCPHLSALHPLQREQRLTWQLIGLMPLHCCVSYRLGHWSPSQPSDETTVLDRLWDPCWPHWFTLHGFHEDQWLTWQFRGVHDLRRLRDWASKDGAKASVATSITAAVISTLIILPKSYRN